MARTVDVHAAGTQPSRLLDDAIPGEEIVIARDGVPLLAPVQAPAARGVPGHWRGQVVIDPDFDAPRPADIGRALGME